MGSKEAFIVIEAAQAVAIVAVITRACKAADSIVASSIIVADAFFALIDVITVNAVAAEAVLAFALERAVNVDALSIVGAVVASSRAFIDITAHKSVSFESVFARTRIRSD